MRGCRTHHPFLPNMASVHRGAVLVCSVMCSGLGFLRYLDLGPPEFWGGSSLTVHFPNSPEFKWNVIFLPRLFAPRRISASLRCSGFGKEVFRAKLSMVSIQGSGTAGGMQINRSLECSLIFILFRLHYIISTPHHRPLPRLRSNRSWHHRRGVQHESHRAARLSVRQYGERELDT